MGTQGRREFLKRVAVAAGGSFAGCARGGKQVGSTRGRPNIVLIVTDDQGYGDLGCLGNDMVRTPSLDRLHSEAVRFTHFHVSPVCSPTRSGLMTGRYNYRTGIVDTYQGRSMMHPDEVTLAEVLGENGYRTGIFGKWHLGDNYPMRAMDQGFQESLVHKGGGICQPSEPRNNTYFDPILKHNGTDLNCKGYCSDVFTDAALAFIEQNAGRAFFAYLAFNAPHEPLIVSETYSAPYLAQGLDENTAKLFGMIANLDWNVGRVLAKLSTLGIEHNTLVIFLTDNGPQFHDNKARFNAGMRGEKGTVYEGGIRVPCFLRWPSRFPAGKDLDRLAAHIDLFPTILDVCGIPVPGQVRLDGRSLLPLIQGEATNWPDRTLFFQWHRGDEPQPYNNCAALTQRYKLVNGKELYDLEADPSEKSDIAAKSPDIAARLRAEYEAWFRDVGSTRGYAPPRIYLGTPQETPSVLTRQDWRGAEGWHDGSLGYWEVSVRSAGTYEIRVAFPESNTPGEARFQLNGATATQPLGQGAAECVFGEVLIPEGDGRLETYVEREGKKMGARQVSVKIL